MKERKRDLVQSRQGSNLVPGTIGGCANLVTAGKGRTTSAAVLLEIAEGPTETLSSGKLTAKPLPFNHVLGPVRSSL